MEDIKVGELVRLKSGRIDKVIYNNCYMQQYIDCERGLYLRDNITKHSFNLTDLIEVGDYVNGNKIISLKGDIRLSDVNDEDDFCYTDYSDEYGEWYGFREDEVKTILTHEQFEANCYKVKGE